MTDEFIMPEIMEWTILPARITARAWTDITFKERLLSHPTEVLREMCTSSYKDKTYLIVEDYGDVKHLVLPAKKAAISSWPKEKILETLIRETGEDRTLKYFLPAEVTVESFFNPEFKSLLFKDANAAFRKFGLNTGRNTFQIVENAESTYHLVLGANPSYKGDLSFDALQSKLLEEFGLNSTKCCASGTCA
jgi:hypothetical protein